MSLNPSFQNYLDLIPPPNQVQPKFIAWLAANVQYFLDQQTCINAINQAFDVQTAVGNQLDILGQIIGVDRLVNFVPSLSTDSPVLSDSNYRICLLAQILKNSWIGNRESVYNFFQTFFPTQPVFIQDNQDMTMIVWCLGMAPGIQQDLVAHGYYVPKPAGVLINYVFADGPLLGFDYENQYIAGLDLGNIAQFSE